MCQSVILLSKAANHINNPKTKQKKIFNDRYSRGNKLQLLYFWSVRFGERNKVLLKFYKHTLNF